jgi:hypothetical protein
MKDIILPLGMYWCHPNVLDAVKHHAVLFKPDVCLLTLFLLCDDHILFIDLSTDIQLGHISTCVID